jgi:hypothetical protein
MSIILLQKMAGENATKTIIITPEVTSIPFKGMVGNDLTMI